MQSLHFETLPEDLIFELLLILKSNKGFSESCEYVNKIYLKYVEKLSLGILNNFDYAYPKDIFFLDKYREMKKEGYTGVYDNLVNYFQNTHIYWRSSISINTIQKKQNMEILNIYSYMNYDQNKLVNISSSDITESIISSKFRSIYISGLISMDNVKQLNIENIKWLYIYKICQHLSDNTVYIGQLNDNTYFNLAIFPCTIPNILKVGYYKSWKYLWNDLTYETKIAIMRVNGYTI